MAKIKAHKVAFSREEMAYDAPAEVDFSTGLVIHGRAAWKKFLSTRRDFAKLAPEVRKAFPDDESVNRALRSLMKRQTTNGKHRKTA